MNPFEYLLTAPESELLDYPITIDGEDYTSTISTRTDLVNRKVNSLVPSSTGLDSKFFE